MKIPIKFKHLVVLAGALVLISTLAMGVWKGKSHKGKQVGRVDEDESAAEMKLTDMEYTEMQKGRRMWTLRAAEAEYFQEDQKTALTKVRLVFFLDDGEEIHLESQHGMLYAGSKDIELWQAVHAVFPRGYELTTERAHYDHKEDLISSKTAILVTGPDLKLQGKHWKYLIPAQRAYLEGQIQATLALEPTRKTKQ